MANFYHVLVNNSNLAKKAYGFLSEKHQPTLLGLSVKDLPEDKLFQGFS